MHMPGTDEERLGRAIAADPTLCAAQVRRSALFDWLATVLLIQKPDGRETSRLLVVSGKMREAERLQFRILGTGGAALLRALEHQFALLKGELAEVSPCES